MDSDPRPLEQTPPQSWLDALDRADADIAAGRTAPWSEVRARLLARLEKQEATQA
jgi:predicted transcriptional regulator